MYYEFHTKYDYDSKFCMWAFSYLRCFRSRYLFGSSFIITGMLFDFLDGMVARKLDSVSEIGGELDSFADLVTFGVAPSILAYSASLKDLQSIGMICALAYSICGMLRLARFNTQQSKLPTFIGMPIPFAAMCLLILCF